MRAVNHYKITMMMMMLTAAVASAERCIFAASRLTSRRSITLLRSRSSLHTTSRTPYSTTTAATTTRRKRCTLLLPTLRHNHHHAAAAAVSLASLQHTSSSSSESSTSSGPTTAAAILLATTTSAYVATTTNTEDSQYKTKLDFAAAAAAASDCTKDDDDDDEDTTTTILNWSGTHTVEVENAKYWEPESVEEVESIIRFCHKIGQPVRPIGSALSPNGIAFQSHGMISMANLDNVIEINEQQATDTENKDSSKATVTVQAGARVSQVIDALRPHGLTLPNLASIAEQQMGGFIQVGAHGTGRCIAPVDQYVTRLKVVTPSKGLITLTKDDGELFELMKVGLGCLGVVVEITMECVPAHNLVEHTFVLTREQSRKQLDDLLKNHKHMRYMHIPYADAVVVVTNDPEDTVNLEDIKSKNSKSIPEEERFQPLTELLAELTKDNDEPYTPETMKGMGFGELRDALLLAGNGPLDIDHVKRVNQAEAEFWRRSEGYQIKPSDQLLQFDCGGQQWVWEVCFPTGTQTNNNGHDMAFMDELLKGIEEKGIPAHSPIEQRWTASSSSLMSPAYGPADGLHTWVGIINYLPSDDENQRRLITESFTGQYCDLMRSIGTTVNATSHWAKIERPASLWKLVDLQLFMQSRFPVDKFNTARAYYDPKNILSNPLIDMVLGKPPQY